MWRRLSVVSGGHLFNDVLKDQRCHYRRIRVDRVVGRIRIELVPGDFFVSWATGIASIGCNRIPNVTEVAPVFTVKIMILNQAGDDAHGKIAGNATTDLKKTDIPILLFL